MEEVKSFSCVWLFVTPWTVTCQAPVLMGFSRQEYWRGLPFPSPRVLWKVNVNQNDCSNVSSLLKYEFQKLYSFGKCQTYRKDIYYNESPFVFPLHSPIANILQHLLLCLFREFILYMMWCLIQSRLQICMSRGT